MGMMSRYITLTSCELMFDFLYLNAHRNQVKHRVLQHIGVALYDLMLDFIFLPYLSALLGRWEAL